MIKLFATNHSPESQAGCLSDLLCCLPQVQAPADLSYTNVFRVPMSVACCSCAANTRD